MVSTLQRQREKCVIRAHIIQSRDKTRESVMCGHTHVEDVHRVDDVPEMNMKSAQDSKR